MAVSRFLDRRHCSEINADFVQLKVDVILAGGRGKGDDIQDGWRPVRNRRPQLADCVAKVVLH